mgnify:CR=1 FL=1
MNTHNNTIDSVAPHTILLIPGYGGTEGELTLGEQGKYLPHIHRTAFERHGKLHVYPWPLQDIQPSPFNFLACMRLYRTQSRMAREEATQQHLRAYIQRTQPTAIIAHSLGARLFLNMYAQNTTLPASVRAIFLTQGDVPRNMRVSIAPQHRFFCGYSPLDEMLWVSTVLNMRVPIGLFGWHTNGGGAAQNIYTPLRGYLRAKLPHNTLLREKECIDAIFGVIREKE